MLRVGGIITLLLFAVSLRAEWIPKFDLISGNRSVRQNVLNTMAVSPQGELVVAGDFDGFRGTDLREQNIARWDGTNWHSLAGGINGPVNCLLAVGQELYAGGSFSVAGGIDARNIARWDGTQWLPLGEGLVGKSVNTLLAYGNRLVAAGSFTNSGILGVTNIAAWDGTNWTALAAGLGPSGSSEVDALLEYAGDLVAGGRFTTAGGMRAQNIALFDGLSWQPIGAGLTNTVVALAGAPDGTLYAGGGQTPLGPSAIDSWNGSVWKALLRHKGGENHGVRVLFWQDGHLYTDAAHMYFENKVPVSDQRSFLGGLVRLDEDGWKFLKAPFYPIRMGPVPYRGRMAFGGAANSAVALNVPYVALWNGADWAALTGGTMGSIETIAFDENGVLAAGRFDSFILGSTYKNFLARWDSTNWSGLSDQFRSSGPVATSMRAIASRSELIVAAVPDWSFTSFEASTVLKVTGTNVIPLGENLNGSVYALTFLETNIYAGGTFGLRQWNGTAWGNVGDGVGGTILAIDGSPTALCAGGTIESAGNISVQNVAFWDGRNWSAMASGVDSNVWAVVSTPQGVFVGGEFAQAGGVTAYGVAHWNGSNWSTLQSGVSLGAAPGKVKALAYSPSGKLYVAGQFDRAGDIAANNIAFWEDRGWHALDEGIIGNVVNALAFRDGALYVGGDFFQSGLAGAHSIALWHEPRVEFGISIELLNGILQLQVNPPVSSATIEWTPHLGPEATWEPAPTRPGPTDPSRFFRARY